MDKEFETCANQICALLKQKIKDIEVEPWYCSNVIFASFKDKILYIKYKEKGHLIISTRMENSGLLEIVMPVLNEYMNGYPICWYNKMHVIARSPKKTFSSIMEYENIYPEPKPRLIELVNRKKDGRIFNLFLGGKRKIDDYMPAYKRTKKTNEPAIYLKPINQQSRFKKENFQTELTH